MRSPAPPPTSPFKVGGGLAETRATVASGTPVVGWVLPHQAVDALAEQVRVAGVAAVLLHQVAHQPAQARVVPTAVACVHKLVEPAVGHRGRDPGTRTSHGVAP